MKRSIVFLLAISLILCLLSCQEDKNPDKTVDTAAKTTEPSASTTTTSPYGDESLIPTDESLFEYEARNIGTVAIKKYIGEEADVVIPAEIGGKKVIEIGSRAFMGGNISSIVLPNCVETIEGSAFMNCSALKKAVLNEGLKTIGSSAFENCESLSEVNLPNSLEVLDSYAFKGCKALKSITVPTDCLGKGSDGQFCFSGLESISLSEGIVYIPSTMLLETNITGIVLPSTVKSVEMSAFSGCRSLVSVKLNDGLERIDHYVFSSTPKLSEVIIPKTVTDMSELAFYYTETQTKVKFEGDAPGNFFDESEDFPGVRDKEREFITVSVYHHEDAKGFDPPEWKLYPIQIW